MLWNSTFQLFVLMIFGRGKEAKLKKTADVEKSSNHSSWIIIETACQFGDRHPNLTEGTNIQGHLFFIVMGEGYKTTAYKIDIL